MTLSTRQIAIFAAGLALGIAGAWLAFGGRSVATAPAPQAAPAAGAVAPAAAASQGKPGTGAVAASTNAAAPCPTQPVAALSGAKDGLFRLQADVSGKSEKDIGAFIVVGKEAAASGRPRDAEVAFMMSCRVAEQQKGAASLFAADAKYQLGWHYANLALDAGGGRGDRAELLRRAERFYADSLQTYRAQHGPTHEKTRFAADGLAALRQPAGPTAGAVVAQGAPSPGKGASAPAASRAAPAAPAAPAASRAATGPTAAAPRPATPASSSAGVTARAPAPASATAKPAPGAPTRGTPAPVTTRAAAPVQAPPAAPAQAQGSARAPAPGLPPEPPRVAVAQGSATAGAGGSEPVRPSFDCGRARSRAERIICSDAELARQDRELGRLYARARDAAPDGAAFRRRNEQEWRRREATCEDRECLLRWYAQRRDQLSADIEQAR